MAIDTTLAKAFILEYYPGYYWDLMITRPITRLTLEAIQDAFNKGYNGSELPDDPAYVYATDEELRRAEQFIEEYAWVSPDWPPINIKGKDEQGAGWAAWELKVLARILKSVPTTNTPSEPTPTPTPTPDPTPTKPIADLVTSIKLTFNDGSSVIFNK